MKLTNRLNHLDLKCRCDLLNVVLGATVLIGGNIIN